MIRKIEHIRLMIVKTYDAGYKETHVEKHLVTTYWFLFIPIYRRIDLLGNNLELSIKNYKEQRN